MLINILDGVLVYINSTGYELIRCSKLVSVFIRKSVIEGKAKHIIVVTHHLPTFQVVAPYHKGSVLNSAFASEYGNFDL